MKSAHSSKQNTTVSARILERVREDATDLALLVTATTHDWKLLSDKNDTKLYEMTGESLSSKVSTVRTFGSGGGGHPSEFYLVRAATTVRADVNTMLDVLQTSTSEGFRAVMKKIFGKQFESGAIVDSLSFTAPPQDVLNSINDGSNGNREDDGYHANWITLRAFTKLGRLDGQRDFTMVSYQDVFERNDISDRLLRKGRHIARDLDRQNFITASRLIGVHTFSSMNFKDIPELPRSSKTDRLHFRNSGIVVEEMEEELACGPMVRVNLLLSLMPSKLVLKELTQSPRLRVALAKGHKVAKKYRKWLQTLALGVSHLAEAAKPTVTMQHLSTMTWTQGDRCFLCLKMFRTFRKQYHCRFCGESVCGSCSSFVDMSLFNVSYESSGSSSSIIVGRCKLNLPATVDGSGRSDNSSHNASVDSTEEYLDIRGCNTCASELQMNLAIRDQCQDARMPTHYGSSNIFSQLANGCPINMGRENKFNQSFGYSSISSSPQSYPGFGNDFERDGTVSRQTDNYYQQNQQYAGQKMSLSSITSSSLSGFSNDERAQLALDTSTSLTEAVGNERLHMSFDRIPTCDLASDASLNEFLAGNSDILLLNESMFHGESATQVPSMMAIIDDSEYMDLTYNLTCRPACRNIRASYATTAATNEESNCSRFNYAGMTLQETQTAEQYVRATNATNTLRMNGRLPLTPLQPKHDPDYKQSSANVSHMVYRTTRQRRLSSSQSHKSSHSSESVRSDLIHLNDPIQAPVTQSNGFVVFSGSRQEENLNHEESDMILLNSEADNKKQSFER